MDMFNSSEMFFSTLTSGLVGFTVSKSTGASHESSFLIGLAVSSSFALGTLYSHYKNKTKNNNQIQSLPISFLQDKTTIHIKDLQLFNIDLKTREGFLHFFQLLSKEIVQQLDHMEMPDVAKQYLSRMIAYNVPHGKLNRGLTAVHTAYAFKGKFEFVGF